MHELSLDLVIGTRKIHIGQRIAGQRRHDDDGYGCWHHEGGDQVGPFAEEEIGIEMRGVHQQVGLGIEAVMVAQLQARNLGVLPLYRIGRGVVFVTREIFIPLAVARAACRQHEAITRRGLPLGDAGETPELHKVGIPPALRALVDHPALPGEVCLRQEAVQDHGAVAYLLGAEGDIQVGVHIRLFEEGGVVVETVEGIGVGRLQQTRQQGLGGEGVIPALLFQETAGVKEMPGMVGVVLLDGVLRLALRPGVQSHPAVEQRKIDVLHREVLIQQ